MILPRAADQLLLPANPVFIGLSLLVAMALNLLPMGRHPAQPDLLALVLVFWNVHQPRRVGVGAAFVFGLMMVFTPGLVDWSQGWPWVKAAAVLLLTAIHGFYGTQIRKFAADRNDRPTRFWRIVNELPFVLVIIIVIMVIVKPF